jgi:hypothetical protein
MVRPERADRFRGHAPVCLGISRPNITPKDELVRTREFSLAADSREKQSCDCEGMTRSKPLDALRSAFLGAQIVMPVASVTGAQVAFDTTNLRVLLAACAGILGAALIGLLALFAPGVLQMSRSRQLLVGSLIGVGGSLALVAPTNEICGIGLFIGGLGAGVSLLGQPFDWNFIRGLIIGPSVGAFLASISWRNPGAFSLVTALLVFVSANTTQVHLESPAPSVNKRVRFTSPFLVFVASTMGFPAALFYLRNETLLQREPLPVAIAIAIGGLLGLWRGRKLAQLGRGRRSIRQGAWLIVVFGVVGSFLTRDTLPDLVGIPFAFLFSLGAARVLASAVTLYDPVEQAGGRKVMSFVVLGASLAVVPLATAGNESLLWQVREVKQSYPNTPSLESLDRGILSMPASFDVARDPRLGALGGPMRAAATFMTQQHLFLAIVFSAGIAAILAFIASFALPRQRSVRSLAKRREKVRVNSTSSFAAARDL